MEQDIEKVENLINKCNECKLSECINCKVSWTEIQSVKRLYEAYKEIEEENKTLNERNQYLVKYRTKLEKELYESNENYIPVSLVEETKKELHENYINSDGSEFLKLKHQLEILEKLLEKRK